MLAVSSILTRVGNVKILVTCAVGNWFLASTPCISKHIMLHPYVVDSRSFDRVLHPPMNARLPAVSKRGPGTSGTGSVRPAHTRRRRTLTLFPGT